MTMDGLMRRATRFFPIFAAAWILACDGDSTGLLTGTVEVELTGLQGVTGGLGSARITGTGIDTTIQLTSASGQRIVPIGTYQVTYTPPASHVLAQGQTANRTVTVQSNQVTTVEYILVPSTTPTGTLTVTVSGLTGTPASGGSVQILRTDIGGQTPVTVAVPASGTLPSTLAVGQYSVTYSPPNGFQLATGSTAQRNVTITSGANTTASYAVVATPGPGPGPGPGAGVVFRSDFSTALGTSDAALRDTSKPLHWTSLRGNGRLNEVIASTGLGFPTANVLRVTTDAQGRSQTHRVDDGIPIPAVGQSLFYRWYIRVTVPDTYTADNLTHPMQDALSNTNWEWEVVTNTNGTWTTRWSLAGNSFPYVRWQIPNLLKHHTYRFEFQIHRNATSTFFLHVRVYNEAGTLLYDDDDVYNTATDNNRTNLAGAPAANFSDVSELRGMNAGFNGLAGLSSDMPFTLYYEGGFCIRTDTWCGAYANGI